jgi:hypothetical protein
MGSNDSRISKLLCYIRKQGHIGIGFIAETSTCKGDALLMVCRAQGNSQFGLEAISIQKLPDEI